MMGHNKNTISQYAFIICLSVTLLFGQTFKLHMHPQHEDTHKSVSTEHIVNVHVASLSHDLQLESHHQKDTQNHHAAEINVNPDSVVKKINSINPIILLFLIFSIVLSVPRLWFFHRWSPFKTKLKFLYYLLHPPSRAPPGYFSI